MNFGKAYCGSHIKLANELYVISEKSFVALYRLVNRDSQFIDDDTDQYIQVYSMYRG